MSKVNCGACRACCKWGGNDAAKVRLTVEEKDKFDHTTYKNPFTEKTEYILASDAITGDCEFVDEKEGCMIHGSAPEACKTFDCRTMLDDMMAKNDVYVNVLIAAISLRTKRRQ